MKLSPEEISVIEGDAVWWREVAAKMNCRLVGFTERRSAHLATAGDVHFTFWGEPARALMEATPSREDVGEISDRGLLTMAPIEGSYGGDIKLWESSAFDPHVWIKIREADDINAATAALRGGASYEGTHHEATIHLPVEKLREFRDLATTMLAVHYQNE